MTERDLERYPPELRIACPLCGAVPAEPCRARGGRRAERAHVARVSIVNRPGRRRVNGR